jgi:biopolymer transport protein ExbD
VILPSPRSKRRARIEIIPLIDIVFFLLATFMMVSLSMIKNQGVSVHLPSAQTGSGQTKGKEYTAITVTKNGQLFFNKKIVSLPELRKNLGELKKKDPDPTIMLNGDDEASLGKAVSVLDETRKAGIQKVAIVTKKPD